MAKTKPGLPEGFDLDLDSPSKLGDYLDEDLSANAVRAIAVKQRAVQPVAPVETQRNEAPPPRPKVVPAETYSAQVRADQVLDIADARRRNAQNSQVARRPERMQFNMRPETLKMFEEIVEYVQRYSLQDDAKASEILDAMIGVLYQAREEMAFNDVPRRGKVGDTYRKSLSDSYRQCVRTSNCEPVCEGWGRGMIELNAEKRSRPGGDIHGDAQALSRNGLEDANIIVPRLRDAVT